MLPIGSGTPSTVPGAKVARCAATLAEALGQAAALGARRVATPALATGYGPLTMAQFGEAVARVVARPWPPLEELVVVLRKEASRDLVRGVLGLVPRDA